MFQGYAIWGFALGVTSWLAASAVPARATEPLAEMRQGSVSPVAAPLEETIQDELLQFADLPVVISANRQERPLNRLPVAASVVTADDIHYSGLATLPEILQFVPGMDVVPIDRNRTAVGIRGLHDPYADRTLTLLNGRVAMNPIFGSAEFDRLPIFLEDIERVEIVRGPGGAAWGANAFNGVVNIVTKPAKAVEGVQASARINEFGDLSTHLRVAQASEQLEWRASLGYRDHESSRAALGTKLDYDTVSPMVPLGAFRARDHAQATVFDGELKFKATEQTQLSLGLAASHLERGDFEAALIQTEHDGTLEDWRTFARLDHEFSDGATGYLQFFGNYGSTEYPSLGKYHSNTHDLEGQINFAPVENHQLTFGGNLRRDRIHLVDSYLGSVQITGPSSAISEYWGGLFLSDHWSVSDRWALETALRADYYSETDFDWSLRIASLIHLDTKKRHFGRIALARSFRAPLAMSRVVTFSRPWFETQGHAHLDNEGIWSLEVGYDGSFDNGLFLRADLYAQRYTDLIGFEMQPIALPVTVRAENIDGADAFGAEIEFGYTHAAGRVSAWYAYNYFDPDESDQPLRAFLPARHKAGVTGRLFLGEFFSGNACADGLVLNLNYRYAASSEATPTLVVDSHSVHRADLTLSKRFWNRHAEVLVGVQDLFNDQEEINFSGLNFMAHEIPGRIFFGRLQVNF